MGKQHTFAGLAWKNKGRQTRRERFLSEMDQIIPWGRLLDLIRPHYPKAGRGRQPLGLEKMLRIYLLQIWFDLSDPQAEDAERQSDDDSGDAEPEPVEGEVSDDLPRPRADRHPYGDLPGPLPHREGDHRVESEGG